LYRLQVATGKEIGCVFGYFYDKDQIGEMKINKRMQTTHPLEVYL